MSSTSRRTRRCSATRQYNVRRARCCPAATVRSRVGHVSRQAARRRSTESHGRARCRRRARNMRLRQRSAAHRRKRLVQVERSGWTRSRAESWCTGARQRVGPSRFTPGCAPYPCRLHTVSYSTEPDGCLQVKENGMQDAVMTLDELAQGEDTKNAGTVQQPGGALVLCKSLTTRLSHPCTLVASQRSTASTPMRLRARCASWRSTATPSAAAARRMSCTCLALTPCLAGCLKATPPTIRA